MAPRRNPPPPIPRAAQLLLSLALLAPSTSCNNDEKSTPPPTTQSKESEVKTAYEDYRDMGARLLEAPDPADPEIPLRTTGKAQADLVAGLQGLKETGRRFELGPAYMHDVLSVVIQDASQATASVCVVDDAALLEGPTGQVVAEGVTTALWEVSLVLLDGEWRVEAVDEGEPKEGVKRCD